jgi:CelD/BcsL family acetyltransferase involved in cellulose biosynthesis/peptidoglycan/xylan/chitin deacetylase (PgdA/CDA1 family)
MGEIEWLVIEDEDGLRGLQDGWRRLAAASADPSMFETYEWNRVWWSTLGRGRTLHVVAGMRAGELVALAPLCTKRGPGGIRIRELLGTEEADQGRLLLAPGEERRGADLAQIAIRDPGWDLLDLWCLPADTPSAAAWAPALTGQAGSRVSSLGPNPVLDIRTGAWREGMRREHLGRKRRALERQGKLSLACPVDRPGVEAALEEFRALHTARWAAVGELSRLTVPSYWEWVRGLSLEALRLGWLRLSRLELDGRLVASGLFFLYRRRLFQWMNAHDLAVARHSPFLLLVHAVLEHTVDHDEADVVDFGRGDEWYKSRWTSTAIPLQRVMAWRGLRGRGAYFWRGRVRPWAWAHPGSVPPLPAATAALTSREPVRRVRWRQHTGHVPILMYHRLTARTGTHPSSLMLERFRTQLSLLRALGYRSVSPLDLARAARGEQPLPPRAVIITLDDGYLDTFVAALPLLLEFGFTATCYLVAERVGGMSDWTAPARLMGWDDAREWLAAGMAIGSHTLTHANLTLLPPAKLWMEVAGSKARLEDRLGVPVESLAYPFNIVGPREMGVVEMAGYGAACAGPELYDSVFALTRLNMASNSISWFLFKVMPVYPELRHLFLTLVPFCRAWRNRAPDGGAESSYTANRMS